MRTSYRMKLVEARAYKCYSLRELGRVSGLYYKTIHNIEKGRNLPSLSTIRKISEALDIKPNSVEEFSEVIQRVINRFIRWAFLWCALWQPHLHDGFCWHYGRHCKSLGYRAHCGHGALWSLFNGDYSRCSVTFFLCSYGN